jgi:hypothetical protein
MLATDLDAAEQAISSVEQNGQAALAEMRRMLAVLHDDSAEAGRALRPGRGRLRTFPNHRDTFGTDDGAALAAVCDT